MIKKYKVLAVSEFTEFVKSAPFEKEIYFADTWDEETSQEEMDDSCCEGWWGFKKTKIFDSDVLFMGWSGGGNIWCADISDFENLESDITFFLKDYVGGTTIENHVALEIRN